MIRIYVNDILDQGQFPLIDDPPPFLLPPFFLALERKKRFTIETERSLLLVWSMGQYIREAD